MIWLAVALLAKNLRKRRVNRERAVPSFNAKIRSGAKDDGKG